MDLAKKYELLEEIAGGDIHTYRARQVPSGRTVLLHKLVYTSEAQQHAELLRLALRYLFCASVKNAGRLLDFDEEQGVCYLVTQDVPECLSPGDWLRSEVGEAKAAFEREPPISSSSVDREKGKEIARTAPQSSSSEPGEFTRLFQRPPGKTQTPERPSLPHPGPLSSRPQAGEFTRLFQQPGESDLPAPSPEREPGEFTRLFGSPPSHGSESSQTTLPPLSPDVPDGARPENHVTPKEIRPADPRSGGATGPSDYTRVVLAPPPAGSAQQNQATQAPPSLPAVAVPRPASPAPSQPPPVVTPQTPVPPAFTRPRSVSPFLILFLVVFLAAAILITLFALR